MNVELHEMGENFSDWDAANGTRSGLDGNVSYNRAHLEDSSGGSGLDPLYKICVPMMCFFCGLSILVNVRVLAAVHWIRRPISTTLHISLSLAAADACTSALICVGLLTNSYLPRYDVYVPQCVSVVVEFYRLSGILVIVMHLLALSFNHWLGILKPLHYTAMCTTRRVFTLTGLLWVLPILFTAIYFLTAGLFHDCHSGLIFLFNFRAIFSSLLLVPLILMSFCYVHILIMVRRQQRVWATLSRSGSRRSRGTTSQQKRTLEGNVKAVYTTLLILGSCVLGWLPAILSFVLICTDCRYDPDELGWSPELGFSASVFINTLIILKTLVNPIIYSSRMSEIKEGIRRMNYTLSRTFCRSSNRSNAQRLAHSGSAATGLGSLIARRSVKQYTDTLV